MFKSRLYFTIFAIIFFTYWFVLAPLLWVYLRPAIIRDNNPDDIPVIWIDVIFWGCVLFIFIIFLFVWWCIMCNLKKRPEYKENDSNSHLDSLTIHNVVNKNIKDRIQLNEMKIDDCSSCTYPRDLHDFLRNNSKPIKPKYNNAAPTADERKSSSTSRVNSCDSCCKSITDDEMVNIFLHKKWCIDDETDDNNVKFEVVGKSVPQAKRFEIIEHVPVEDVSPSATLRQGNTETTNISIPVRPSSRLKSEVFIMINDDYSLPKDNVCDDVFK